MGAARGGENFYHRRWSLLTTSNLDRCSGYHVAFDPVAWKTPMARKKQQWFFVGCFGIWIEALKTLREVPVIGNERTFQALAKIQLLHLDIMT